MPHHSAFLARCIRNRGSQLRTPRGFYYGRETEFSVTPEKCYLVFGLGVYETVLLGLVQDDTEYPNWMPMGLFEVKAIECPTRWEFALLDGIGASGGQAPATWTALWGYPELVRNAAHRDGLIEREPKDLAVFFRYSPTKGPPQNDPRVVVWWCGGVGRRVGGFLRDGDAASE